jgi:MCP family monocarboxylic acid transporter-like MFS transporter 10
MVLPIVTNWWIVLAIVLVLGMFEGGFVSLLGKIATQLCGVQGAAQALGFLCGLCSIPLTAGPPVAGTIFI